MACCSILLGSETNSNGKDDKYPPAENDENGHLRLGDVNAVDLVLGDNHLLESLLVEANLLLTLNNDNSLEEDNSNTLLVQEVSIRIRLLKVIRR